MKSLEKVAGISVEDIKELVPGIKSAYDHIAKKYKKETHPKLRMLDNMIITSFVVFIIQVFYGVFINRDPFNSFVAGVFCSLG
mmetsp:Transcript_21785/g.15614  ORF Transcript_21785/g.15614 Transcript_21785/m.15614 type:complete len:83 (+) Transcript_21785:31-279(+)